MHILNLQDSERGKEILEALTEFKGRMSHRVFTTSVPGSNVVLRTTEKDIQLKVGLFTETELAFYVGFLNEEFDSSDDFEILLLEDEDARGIHITRNKDTKNHLVVMTLSYAN